MSKGSVTSNDDCVIAWNPRNITFEYADTQPPRILLGAYAVGLLYVNIDRETGKAVSTGYHFRDHIVKTPKRDAINEEAKKPPAKVTTGVFQDKKHDALSGLLCSRVDAANRRGEIGEDFQLAPNPHASVPHPESFR